MSKLGDAIREGDALLPQIFDAFFEWSEDAIDQDRTVPISGCAVGQACYAVGWRTYSQNGSVIYFADEAFALEDSIETMCPACPSRPGSIMSLCTHLNDGHKWTSLQIADWVDKVMKEHGHE